MIQFRIIIEEIQVVSLHMKFNNQALPKVNLGKIIAVNNVHQVVWWGVVDWSI